MELKLEDIISVTQGAERIWEDAGAVWFSRFTEEEQQIYKTHDHLALMVRATAGIQMELTTDATALSLQVTTPPDRNYADYFSYDILVNDTLTGRLSNVPEDAENGDYNKAARKVENPAGIFNLGEGVKTLRIVFPWSMNLGITKLALEGASFIRPVEKAKTLLIYGDSITQGSGSIYSSKTYASMLRDRLQVYAFNKGVGSEKYFPALSEVTPKENIDYITVAYGVNDRCSGSEEEYISNFTGFWTGICRNYPKAKKFMLLPIYYLNEAVVKPFCGQELFLQLTRKLAEQFPEVTVIDCTDFVSRDTADFGDLYIHPNHKGYTKYITNLQEAITPYL